MKKFDKIYIEITNVCNLNCKFCDNILRDKAFMSIKDFEIIIEKIKEYTKLIALHVKGEPLLHPNLKEILEICSLNKISVNITTNSILLDKNIEILANSSAVRQLNLSIHSLMQNGLDVSSNLKTIFNSVDKIRSLNKNIIFSYRLWNIKSIEKNDVNTKILEMLSQKYKINNLIQISKLNKFAKLEENVYLNQDIEFEWPSLKKKIICENGNCYGIKKQLGILVDGTVVPCCLDQNGDIKLGNILNENLEEILNSIKVQKILKGFNENKLVENLCKRCGFVNLRLK